MRSPWKAEISAIIKNLQDSDEDPTLDRIHRRIRDDINAQDNHGWAILHDVCHYLSMSSQENYEYSKYMEKAIEILLQNGANPNAKNEDDNTPLHFLVSHEKEHIWDHKTILKTIGLLIENGARVDEKNYINETPLDILIGSITQVLSEEDDEEAEEEEMESLLDSSKKTIEKLLDAGATLKNKTIDLVNDFIDPVNPSDQQSIELIELYNYLRSIQKDFFLKKHALFISHEGHIQPKPNTQKTYWDNKKDIRDIKKSIQIDASELYTPLTQGEAIKVLQEYKEKEVITIEKLDLMHLKLKNSYLHNEDWFNLYLIDKGSRSTLSTKGHIKDLPEDILRGPIAAYLLPKLTKYKCKQWLNTDALNNASPTIAQRGFSALIENYTKLKTKLRALDTQLIEAAKNNSVSDSDLLPTGQSGQSSSVNLDDDTDGYFNTEILNGGASSN